MRVKQPLLYSLLFGAAALLFLSPVTACPNCLAGQPFSDLVLSHLPNALYWRTALSQYGQWPWWNASLFLGQPFAADPLSGVWYPPNLLLLLLPLPFAFNLLYSLHLAWAGYGLFRFLRAESLPIPAALLGGLAWAGTPKLLAHIGAGHFSLVCAVAWTPWLLSALRAARWTGGARAGAGAGATLAMIFLADPRWAFYAAALGGAFWLAALPPFAPRRLGHNGLTAAVSFTLFFLTLSAVLALPLSAFALQSNRTALTFADAAVYSLPPLYLVGLFIPNLHGFHEWMTYLGVVPLLLAVLGGLGRRQWFWLTAALTAAAFALGSNFVLFPMLYRLLPGLIWLRVPARAWFCVALAGAVLAAYGLDYLLAEALPRLKASPALPRLRRWIPSAQWAWPALLLLTVLDLWRVDVTLVETHPLPAPAPAAAWLLAQPGAPDGFRVYSPSLSLLPGDGLQHADGVDPLQLAAVTRFIQAASGALSSGYSVTVPTFAGADAAPDIGLVNAYAIPEARGLGLLNVKYVATEFDLSAPGLRLVKQFGRTRVYVNEFALPRAWMDTGAPADVAAWSPNHLEVRATGPGLLTLSEAAYPGWRVWVDGQPAALVTAQTFLRGVQLTAGPHTVIFEFWPVVDFIGLGLTSLGVLGLGGLLWRTRSAP